MRKIITTICILFIGFGLGVVLILTALPEARRSLRKAAGLHVPEDKEKKKRLHAVEVRPVRASTYRFSLSFTGTVQPVDSARLAFETGGRIKSISKDVGDSVTAGEVLAELDTSLEKVRLKELKLGIQKAERDLVRARTLQQKGTLGNSLVLDAITARDMAIAAYNSAETALTKMTLKSPTGGVLTIRMAEPGEVIAPGVPLFTVENHSQVKIIVEVPEHQIAAIRGGQSAEIIPTRKRTDVANGGGESKRAGSVTCVAPSARPGTHVFPVEITVGNSDGFLRPGNIATAKIFTRKLDNVYAFPLEAVVERAGRKVIYVVRDNIAHETALEAYTIHKYSCIIESGLSDDDLIRLPLDIVVRGQHGLLDGTPVTVRRPPESTPAQPEPEGQR
ncbi:MAG: efflux RND transporter periplasmic adaptor subunit [Planctomycetota bacterium]|nr:MAG: efflux RND transporter periplasmic adaptor subunit [Planctomycetota bacterium]